jgi:hypothetical protein
VPGGEGQLPPHLVIGRHTIRYDVAVVEDWLAVRQGLTRERLTPYTQRGQHIEKEDIR